MSHPVNENRASEGFQTLGRLDERIESRSNSAGGVLTKLGLVITLLVVINLDTISEKIGNLLNKPDPTATKDADKDLLPSDPIELVKNP